MDQLIVHATPYVALLVLSVVLLVVHVMMQGFLATRELGSQWNAGPRDEERKPQSPLAGRAARASANYRETYPAVVGLLLALAFYGDLTGWGLIGGWLWFLCRLVYIPLYLGGVPYIRSLVWLGSLLGIGIMILGLFV
ncbi:MAPEG family protein [Rhizobium sp. SSA_523]|uniref:MAPEG family protein n=1 Tax=Rhizobium sp. SSA_523 TaxID=2952477 RepID=UPI002090D8DE|nr:MAPEG family protein [Rhizobium sp. SSA_523]MCO5733591.1 MAPEG family protein [Rhizobium sp. SSA_523]WKC23112.1 MAPEG family protein [Rhizobium sp. SSA_523]